MIHIVLALLAGVGLAKNPIAGYTYSYGACRGGDVGGNAGLKFFRNRNCKSLCDSQAACTGFVLPASNSNWCETYTSKGAKGDGRNFYCYMKNGNGGGGNIGVCNKAANCGAAGKEYIYSYGACRFGEKPANNAGLKFYGNRNCQNLCNSQATCTGFVLPVNGANWCETYTSKGAKGDGRNYWCFMKKNFAAPAGVCNKAANCGAAGKEYIYSKGACRNGDKPANNAGLKFYANRNCQSLCDSQATCTGFVLPVNGGNWCETYTSKGAKGDNRNYWCFMKKNFATPVGVCSRAANCGAAGKEYIYSKGACRGGDKPAGNAGLKFYGNRNCQSLCDSQATCTGFVLPVDGRNWCETYLSPKAKGDNRNFWCFMKKNFVAPTPAPKPPTPAPSVYYKSVGACRGGQSPANNAGLKFFRNRSCQTLCNSQATCTGYVLPVSNSNWCETYTSRQARGDGRTQFTCFMKEQFTAPPTPAPTNPSVPGYTFSKGACRNGDKPANNAGLKFFSNRNCLTLCNSQATCTGFVLPVTNSNWCETYTSPNAKGDGRNYYCFMKDAPKPVDCVVSAFGPWGNCSEECGGGEQTRTRTVTTPAKAGGEACPALTEKQACNEDPCVEYGSVEKTIGSVTEEEAGSSAGSMQEAFGSIGYETTVKVGSVSPADADRRRLQDGELGTWIVQYDVELKDGKTADDIGEMADSAAFNSALLKSLEAATGRTITLPGALIMFPSFKAFKDWCTDEVKAAAAEDKADACKFCIGKYKKGKCKLPKKTKKLKCKKIKDMDFCKAVACGEKKGKCNGKTKLT